MKKITTLLFIFLFCSLAAFAQTKVDGVVKDQAGKPVQDAAVMQKGTTQGTATDANGRFSVPVSESGQKILVVSKIGHNSIEVHYTPQTTVLNITLDESAVVVDEVVVVGFGTQKKATVTGSISSIQADDLTSTPTPSPTNALTGRVSGLVTRQESGRPGSDEAKLFVRTQTSYNDNSPLVLVDGIERSMSQISSEDIESISVLKDAAATAIYGVRGANGVVLVTTKRGKEGKTNISFSSQWAVTDYIRITETLNAETVGMFMREGVKNDGLDPTSKANTRQFGVSEYDLYLYNTQLSPFTHPDNNFVDMFTKSGWQQRYNVNVSGGTEGIKYFVSVGYQYVDGMFETDVNKLREHPTIKRLIELSPAVDKAMHNNQYDPGYFYNKTTVRTNLDIKLAKDLKFTVDLSYLFSKENRPGVYDDLNGGSEGMRLFGMFYRNSPQNFPVINANGSMAGFDNVWRQNPYTTLTQTGFKSSFKNVMQTNFALNYDLHKVLKGLTAEGKFSYDSNWNNWWGVLERPAIFKLNPDGTYDENGNPSGVYTQGLAASLPVRSQLRDSPTGRKYGEFSLRYRNTFAGKHNVSAVALGTYESTNVPDEGDAKYSYVPEIFQALRGRVNYDYKNRYLVEGTVGYTGSNRFAEGQRYRLFPSVSVGWVPTEEKFIAKNDIMTFLKFRASYGEAGNSRLGGFSYYYQSSYAGSGAQINYSFGNTWNPKQTGYYEDQMANPNVTWEETKDYNFGIDSRWFKNAVTVTFDMFKNERNKILVKPDKKIVAAGVQGLPPYNIGETKSHGYELEVSYRKSIRDFNFMVKGIYSYARSEAVATGESDQSYYFNYKAGNRINQYMGYKFDGFFESYEQIAASPQQFGFSNLGPGDIKYKDINGDGIIDDNDKCAIGYSYIPEINYSLALDMDWKGIGLSILFQGAGNSSIWLTGDLGWDNNFGNYYENHINRWTPETAATATYPRFHKNNPAGGENANNYKLSDYWLYSGNYLRLKNVQLSYDLPKKWLKRLSIGSVKVYANAYNLVTWDKCKMVDPESPKDTDGYFYPQQRMINGGVTITF